MINSSISKKQVFIILIYIAINSLFIYKYGLRTPFSPIAIFVVYLLVIITSIYLFKKFSSFLSEITYKRLTWFALTLVIACIGFLIYKIDPLSVRVDRWSAVSYFLDALFQSKYPYAAHTHVSTTNFPSPFPIWYVINLPFYLLGDMGYGLIFFLFLYLYAIKMVFNSYKYVFMSILLLVLSPAYWWEVLVRSDSLSNGILVFAILLLIYKKKFTIEKQFILMIVLCGIIACTRLSAVIPVVLFLFRPYIGLNLKMKILFPIGIIVFMLLCFAPFIFWDTNTWVFFERNPFMSQTSVGNVYILIAMVALGIYVSFRWKNLIDFNYFTAIFIFIFISLSQLSLIFNNPESFSFTTDSNVDISYFTLSLPYLIVYFTTFFEDNYQSEKTDYQNLV